MLNAVSSHHCSALGAVSGTLSIEMRRTLVIATCSASKRLRSGATVSALPRADQETVSRHWLATLKAEEDLLPARRLYKGRSFQIARDASDKFGASFGVISAGLGFVRGSAPIPGYDLTVTTGKPSSISHRVEGAFSPSAWWRAVQRGPFASDLRAEAVAHDLVLVSLSRDYLAMVVEDLLAIEAAAPGRLRLFALSLKRHLPDSLKPCLMPYDSRLDRIGRLGTRTDFAARALCDFLDRCDLLGDAYAHACAVEERLASAPTAPPARPQRRVDDARVRKVIRSYIAGGGRSSAKALAFLRGGLGLSCEQRRFSALYRQVSLEMSA